MVLDIRLRAFLLALFAALGFILPISGNNKVTIRGRVSAIAEEADEGRFAIVGDNESVTLEVNTWGYLIDYLRASNGREIELTLEPK